MKMLEYIHATLIVMLVLPVMYAVAGLKDADGEGMLYLKCLLIAVPIVVTGIAVRRLKNLGLYLLSCLAVTTAIWVVIRLFFGGSGALYPKPFYRVYPISGAYKTGTAGEGRRFIFCAGGQHAQSAVSWFFVVFCGDVCGRYYL